MGGEAQTKPKFAYGRGFPAGAGQKRFLRFWRMTCFALVRMFGKIAKLFKRSAGKQSETPSAASPTAMPESQPLGQPNYAVPGLEVAVETAEPVAVASSDTTHTRGDSIV